MKIWKFEFLTNSSLDILLILWFVPFMEMYWNLGRQFSLIFLKFSQRRLLLKRTHRCTLVENLGLRVARVFAKMPGGTRLSGKITRGGPLILDLITFLLTCLVKFAWGAGGAYVYPPPYLCASMNEQKRVFQTIVRIDNNSNSD